MSILRRVRGTFERLAARLGQLSVRRRPALVRVPKASRALLLALVAAPSAFADSGAELITYPAADNHTVFALSLTPPAVEASESCDVVVLFDTSASQIGVYRETALAALESCIAKLRPSDRVQILAADLEARPLTEEFLAVGSPELKAAIAALRQQLPLGSTDMEGALRTATSRFEKDSKANRAVLYFGDGMSTANFLGTESFRALIDELRTAHVPVSSYAIGPRRDGALLAAIANQTGGNLYVDEAMIAADDAQGVTTERANQENLRRGATVGESLAKWTQSQVFWPQNASLPKQLGEVFPRQVPPLRGDRETIVVGTTSEKLDTPLEIEFQASTNGEWANLTWTAQPKNEGDNYAYLTQVVEAARADNGLTLPTVGLAGLAETGRMLDASLEGMTDLAQRAVATGDMASADQMSQAVLRRDPGNVRARTVQQVIRRPQNSAAPAVAAAAPSASDDLSLVRTAQLPLPPQSGAAPATAYPAEGAISDQFSSNGAFLDEVEQQKRVFSQMLRREVENTIVDARRTMSEDPEAASQQLKLALQNVERAPELNPDMRAQLIDKLQNALREVQRQATIKDELDAAREEEMAVAREQQMLNDRLLRNIEREKQLVGRFGALIDERRYDDAMEVADAVEELDPNGVVPRVASLWSEMKRNDYLTQIVRAARWEKFWETLYQVEIAAIPFPDEPPIVYPEAPVWEELTIRRKKFASVDLKAAGGAEQRINDALNSSLKATGLDFTEQPLEDVVNFLQTEYNIPIQLDTPALEDAGLTTDEPVTINLQNITLRSGLRIMLKQLSLTYIIQDEVMFITTPERAEEDLIAKVYPVADLVLPIEAPQVGGGIGGGGGGQGGGQGGGGGGFGGGGGGGGFGGGGGGGQGGGGGGGLFSVPDDGAPTNPAPASQNDLTLSHPASTDSQPAAKHAKAAKPAPIQIDENLAPEAFWNEYFTVERDPAAIRQAARDLMAQKKTVQLIAMIQAALAHGQPQPWMYESLGIALELNGAPKAEIERVLMSAADFSTTPDELLYIAGYLSRSGLDRRALQLCQQVIKIQPLRREAYALGLRSAENAKDLAGIQWATVGILGQAWTKAESPIHDAANEAAHTALAELEKQGRTEELNTYRQQLKAAEARDCVVNVSWTGSADVDVEVEEPTGTICSTTVPRTTAGGVSLGDAFASEGEESPVLSETYVCPKGFPGKYNVRIHRVWGEVAAGKVTVDVVRHQGTDDEQHERRQLDLTDKDAMVVFELDSGRRNEPLENVQLAGAVERQKQVSRSVLAQQFESLSDSRLLGGQSEAQRRRQMAGVLGLGGGAVGFQPIIQVLPEGTQLGISGVISADRRYVRIGVAPVFSTIGDVQTFTFAGSSQQTDGGGTGNGGGGAGF